MLQLVLAASVFTVATAVYAAIGLRWRRRARIRREILGVVGALDLEPYHAAATESRATEAAAAELLLGGYLDIDGEGAALLAEAGRDPGRTPVHPLPAALLDAVRRHDPEPVSIGWIDWHDEEYRARRSAYRSERDALLPDIPRMPDGDGRKLLACCACTGVTLLLSFWTVAAVLLVMARPHGVLEWAAAAAAAAGLAALWFADDAHQAVLTRTACEDPLGDRIGAEPPHPSLAALDQQQRFHVLRSIGDHTRWRGTDQGLDEDGAEDEDDDWMDDDWWADAYHYRATDHEKKPDDKDAPDDEPDDDARCTRPGACPSDRVPASCPGRCSGHGVG
ncbi:hypothetical protein OG259_02175 [Streptomyces sp. NBC_00250]|uniref:hypothetical protein n=1 Tax=Streptomyces sp. NBC_00250 TaxID=2903641 RepID=UPI002E2A29FB|nr:hypothetical protein [Streptomyces sp. NBC_00250]